MDAFSKFLKNQRKAAARSPTGTPPPVGPIPHKLAVESYHTLIHELICKSSYLVGNDQLKTILKWATEEAVTSEDSESSWQLLTGATTQYINVVEMGDVHEFISESLCTLSPAYISWKAWCCVTAWMVRACNNQANLDGGDNIDYAADVRLPRGVNWAPWRRWLTEVALKAPGPAASRASQLLARLVVWDAQRKLTLEEWQIVLKDELEVWQETLRGAVKTLCGRLPTAWHDSPPLSDAAVFRAAAAQELSPESLGGRIQEIKNAARAAQRALLHLQAIIDCGQNLSLPSRFAHSSSYRDVQSELVLQINIQQPAIQKFTLSLPRNSYVGTLRTMAAELGSERLNLNFQASQLRMLSGGKEHTDDGVQLIKAGITSPIMFAWLHCPNAAWSLSPDARAELDASSPAEMLASAQKGTGLADVYSLALTMEDVELPTACDENGTLRAALKSAARGVLGALPTSSNAIADIEMLLLEDNGYKELMKFLTSEVRDVGPSKQQQQHLGGNRSKEESSGQGPSTSKPGTTGSGSMPTNRMLRTKDAVVRYTIETLCTQIIPSRNPLLSTCQVTEIANKASNLENLILTSGVFHQLLNFLTRFSDLGGQDGAPRLHSAMLLLTNALCEGLQNSAQVYYDQGDQSRLQLHYRACRTCFTSVSDYVIHMMSRALGTFSSGIPFAPQIYAPGSAPSPVISSLFSITSTQALHVVNPGELCSRGLDVLRTCLVTFPEFATKLCQIGGRLLSTSLLALLGQANKGLRDQTREWVEMFSESSSAARKWIFEVVITPLLLAAEQNEAELQLTAGFLTTLNPEEAEIAKSVFHELVRRFLETAASGAPLRGMVESILTLVRQLECHSIPEVRT